MYERAAAQAQDAEEGYGLAAMAALLPLVPWDRVHRVVELGCGTGKLLRRLYREGLLSTQRSSYYALDQAPQMLQLAQVQMPLELSDSVQLHNLPGGDPAQILEVSAIEVYSYVTERDDQLAWLRCWMVLRCGLHLCGAANVSGTTKGGAGEHGPLPLHLCIGFALRRRHFHSVANCSSGAYESRVWQVIMLPSVIPHCIIVSCMYAHIYEQICVCTKVIFGICTCMWYLNLEGLKLLCMRTSLHGGM